MAPEKMRLLLGSPSAPREAARRARRDALLVAAETVFAERGFAGATMAEIASRAGYSAGNLYNVFANKEALFKEVMTARGRLFVEQLLAALRGGGSFVETLDRYLDAFLRFVAEQRGFFVILTRITGSFEWEIGADSAEAHEIRDPVESATLALFERGVRSGELPIGEPEVYTATVTGALIAYASRWVRRQGEEGELWAHLPQLRSSLHRALGVV